MQVIHEVIMSASRIKNSLHIKSNIPNNCENKIELVLYTDRNIFDNKLIINKNFRMDFLEELKCIFDRIIYYDDFLSIDSIVTSLINNYNRKNEIFARLSTRTNLLKLLTLLSSPFQYTLYLGKSNYYIIL